MDGNDVIIIAVAHDDYKNFTEDQLQKMFNGNGVLIDVKSIYDKDFFPENAINYWRL